MTLEQMINALYDVCNKHKGTCCGCPLFIEDEDGCVFSGTDSGIKRCYELVYGKTEITQDDVVNHPSHYNRDGGMECLDEMILVFGREAVKNFCICNAWKYRYRASAKNGEEDLKKSDFYINKYKELCSYDTDCK